MDNLAAIGICGFITTIILEYVYFGITIANIYSNNTGFTTDKHNSNKDPRGKVNTDKSINNIDKSVDNKSINNIDKSVDNKSINNIDKSIDKPINKSTDKFDIDKIYIRGKLFALIRFICICAIIYTISIFVIDFYSRVSNLYYDISFTINKFIDEIHIILNTIKQIHTILHEIRYSNNPLTVKCYRY